MLYLHGKLTTLIHKYSNYIKYQKFSTKGKPYCIQQPYN